MFLHSNFNFDLWESEVGNKNYYVFMGQDLGWCHSTQFRNPVANDADEKEEKIPDGYGLQTTPEAVANAGRKRIR